MTWFKVDDGFWSNPKTMTISESATSLWVRAGSYSCQHLTDGFIPGSILRILGSQDAAIELVDANLWKTAKDGYRFHDWGEYQETSSTVKTRREQAKERQRKRRSSHVSHTAVTRDRGVTSHEVSTPDPTRPDQVKDMRIASDSAAFEKWWAAYPRRKDRGHAEKAFRKAIKLVSLDDLIAATEAFAKSVADKDSEFIAYGATWLNGKRWTDEDIAPVTDDAIASWLRKCWESGDTRSIEERSGLTFATPDLPEHIETPDQGREFMLAAAREWLTDNREVITERILRKGAA